VQEQSHERRQLHFHKSAWGPVTSACTVCPMISSMFQPGLLLGPCLRYWRSSEAVLLIGFPQQVSEARGGHTSTGSCKQSAKAAAAGAMSQDLIFCNSGESWPGTVAACRLHHILKMHHRRGLNT